MADTSFSTIKGVLFDLDGTLVDSIPDLAVAVDRMLLALGREAAGINQVRDWVGNGASVLVQRALAGERIPKQDDPDFEIAYRHFLHFYEQNVSAHSALYPGVLATLRGLQDKDLAMAVVTNKPLHFTELLLQALGLDGFFAVVIGGDSTEYKKPHAAPLQSAIEQLALTPEEVVMVGDSITDVNAARAASVPVIAVPYGYNHGVDIREADPDLVIEQLEQLLGLF